MAESARAQPGWAWSRIGPSLFVLAAILISTLVPALAMYLVGKRWEESGELLKNYRAPTHVEVQNSFVMNYVRNSSEKNDVLFIGDSTCLEGLMPRLFKEQTGLTAYNFNIFPYAAVLREYLHHHPRPRLVVLCIFPKFLEIDVGNGIAETAPFMRRIRLGFWVTFGYCTGGFASHADEPVVDRAGQSYQQLVAEMTRERGYWEAPANPLNESFRGLTRCFEQPSAIKQSRMETIYDLARVAEDNDIFLLVRFPPVLPGSGPDDPAFLHAWSKELEAKFPKLVVSRPELLYDNPVYFWDELHLNRQGAEKFTRFVAGEVKRVLGGR